MGLFGLLNYEDYLVDLVIKSDKAHNGLIIFILCIITGIVRFHLSAIFCYLFYKDNAFDLIFPIIITVILSLLSNILFQYIETHKPIIEELVEYFIDNYTLKNFIKWKRIFLLGICCYVLLANVLITIDNYFVFLTTMQTAISFIICDLLENKMPRLFYNKILNWLYQPNVIIYPQIKEQPPNKSDIIQPLPTYTQEHPIIENYVKSETEDCIDSYRHNSATLESEFIVIPDKSEIRRRFIDKEEFVVIPDMRRQQSPQRQSLQKHDSGEIELNRESDEIDKYSSDSLTRQHSSSYMLEKYKSIFNPPKTPEKSLAIQDIYESFDKDVVYPVATKPRTPPRLKKSSSGRFLQ